jgi:hypothetical protein
MIAMSGNIDILLRLQDVANIGQMQLQAYCDKWHKSQTLKFLDDGSLVFRARVSGLDEIGWWIDRLLCKVTVFPG